MEEMCRMSHRDGGREGGERESEGEEERGREKGGRGREMEEGERWGEGVMKKRDGEREGERE